MHDTYISTEALICRTIALIVLALQLLPSHFFFSKKIFFFPFYNLKYTLLWCKQTIRTIISIELHENRLLSIQFVYVFLSCWHFSSHFHVDLQYIYKLPYAHIDTSEFIQFNVSQYGPHSVVIIISLHFCFSVNALNYAILVFLFYFISVWNSLLCGIHLDVFFLLYDDTFDATELSAWSSDSISKQSSIHLDHIEFGSWVEFTFDMNIFGCNGKLFSFS